MTKQFWPAMALTLTLLATTGAVGADTLPDHYPDPLPLVGVLDALDNERRRIVVNDAPYRMAAQLAVATPSNINSTVAALTVGDRVVVRLAGDGSSGVVEKIWLLPSGYQQNEEQ